MIVALNFVLTVLVLLGVLRLAGAAFSRLIGRRLSARIESRLPANPVKAWVRRHHEATTEWTSRTFYVFFALFVASAGLWLAVGLLPAFVQVPSLHDLWHEWGGKAGFLGEFAANVAQASHSSENALQVTIDYLFSAVNIGLGLFLVWRVPRNQVARLLSIGMIGTAVAFNLQSHLTRSIMPVAGQDALGIWHDGLHVLSGVCYVFALLLFPEGKLASRARLPYWLFVTLIVTQLSLIAAQDHTVGLVMIFGIFVPLVALSSQVRRYRTAATAAVRQQSKVLLSAMAFALLAAVGLVGVTVAFGGSGDLGRQAKLYEFHSPAAGEYFFRCDPHPDDMHGTVAFVDDGDTDNSVSVEASDYEFDKDRLTLAAREPVKINFTNEDGDIHNVAIYRTRAAEQPVFVGELFSGEQLATVAFRIFRPVFTVIPIALFIGILHFHLWDIDRLINRALVYGLVTALIGTIYVAGIILFQRVLEPFIEGSVVAATISTLVATALFRPARRGIQEFVDRRFYRSRYDSYKTLEDFGSRLRREVELESVSADLLDVVKEAVQPSHVSLWLRESDGGHSSEPHLPEEEIEPIRLRTGGNPRSRNDSGTMEG